MERCEECHKDTRRIAECPTCGALLCPECFTYLHTADAGCPGHPAADDAPGLDDE